tara:strand:- start:808 stop:954 length:147 start_codon:yes stop_codon:yes gene_type:complete
MSEEKQKLVDVVIKQMKMDIAWNDWTAIEGLLLRVDSEWLHGFVEEEE